MVISEVKIAVPCDNSRRPMASNAIFHEKTGLIEDKAGDRIAFTGSMNETAAGWTQNWESLHLSSSRTRRLVREEENFAKLWVDHARHALTIDVPVAVRDDLLRFLPRDNRPPALKGSGR